MDDHILWYEGLTEEEHLEEFPPLSAEELEEIEQNKRDAGYLPPLSSDIGVQWLSSEALEAGEVLEDEEEENLPSTRLPCRDVQLTRYLTNPQTIRAIPAEKLLARLAGTVEHHVWVVHNKSAGTFDRDDLRSAAHLKILESLDRFTGRGPFGAYADVVISRALIDYARKELSYQQHEQLRDSPAELAFGYDPTDDWVAALDIRHALSQAQHADLLVARALGMPTKALGDPSILDMRRSRAKKRVIQTLHLVDPH